MLYILPIDQSCSRFPEISEFLAMELILPHSLFLDLEPCYRLDRAVPNSPEQSTDVRPGDVSAAVTLRRRPSLRFPEALFQELFGSRCAAGPYLRRCEHLFYVSEVFDKIKQTTKITKNPLLKEFPCTPTLIRNL